MATDNHFNRHEDHYSKIIKFYDLAEEIIEHAEKKNIDIPKKMINVLESVIEKLEHSTDALAEEYRAYVRTGKKPGYLARKRIEKALDNIYISIQKLK